MVFRNIPEMPDIARVTWFMELEKGLKIIFFYSKRSEKNQDNPERK